MDEASIVNIGKPPQFPSGEFQNLSIAAVIVFHANTRKPLCEPFINPRFAVSVRANSGKPPLVANLVAYQVLDIATGDARGIQDPFVDHDQAG